MLTWLVTALLIAAPGPQASRDLDSTLVQAEIRVFDRTEDVTTSTSAKVTAAHRRNEPLVDARLPLMRLVPAVYDVEVSRTGNGGVVQIARAERLTIMHYADEGGRHLEVINFDPGFGALQIRSRERRLPANDVSLFREGERSTPAARPISGSDYVLFAVPAGRYDVQVRRSERGSTVDPQWLMQVSVPAGATRLKIVDAGG